jgi:alkylation response protein AidB-like acyl-CoA dehydrogenase
MILTDEQLEIREMARDFAAGEIRPVAASWDESRTLDDGVFSQLGDLGFMGMMVPEAHGGLGLDAVTYLLALEQIAWGDASVALTVAIQNGPLAGLLLDQATDDQKAAWLPRLASGELVGAFALSEPRAGSDASALTTVAEPHGDGWRISGTKKWVTNGDRAGLVTVFARIQNGSPETDRMGAFLVDRDSAGYSVARRERTMGLRASETVEVVLDDVRVADDRLLSLNGDGFVPVLRALDLARLGDAAISLGIAQSAFEHAVRYALERSQFGHPIADFGAIQAKLADMATRIAGARALAHHTAARFEAAHGSGAASPEHGAESLRAMAAMAKLAASDAALWIADEAVQIYGGYGYMRDYPVEKLLRDAKGTQLLEGTSEIMRVAIAREVIKDAKEG